MLRVTSLSRSPFLALTALVALPFANIARAADERISFNQHIRPILSENCFACHGPDAKHREAKLRLDLAESATAERNGFRAIAPGDVANSEAWSRIISTDPDTVMPPPDSHKTPLKPEQRALIKRWIEQGAVYQKHWAYEPIARPALPAPSTALTRNVAAKRNTPPVAHNPVDLFIAATLSARNLPLSAEASREILFRRVTLDLTGLPPTPSDVSAFLADTAPDAYERAVDRLLASPRYGEHFARYWLDAVRYADTHGLHLDNVRSIWPYRDWVVNAFNRNLPFDQFTVEQLAGDQLPAPRIDQLVASGYNRNILSTSEGGAIEAEAEMRNTADRADTTAAVWLGLTANCASCHDHKFDPLSQREYYAFGAIFKGLADRVWDGNIRVPGPIAVIGADAQMQARIDLLAIAIKPLEAMLTARADAAVAKTPLLKLAKNPITYEVIWAEDSDLITPEDFAAKKTSTAAPRYVREGRWREGPDVPVVGGYRALRLEGGAAIHSFAFTAGDVLLTVRTEARAFVHVRPDPTNLPRAISLEFISAEKTKRFIWGDPQAFGPEIAATAKHAGPIPTATDETLKGYIRLEIPARDGGVAEGKEYTGLQIMQAGGAAWYDRAGAALTSPSGIDDPLLSRDAWARGLVRDGYRFSEDTPLRHDIKFLIGLSATQQNAEEKARLTRYHRDYIYGPLRAAVEDDAHAVRRLYSEQIHYELTNPMTLISRELPEPRAAHIMIRGQYDKPGDRVEPGTPAFLPPPRKSNPAGRLTRFDLAQWIVAPENPLTARVTVNRFWQQLFGAGLVRTPADFGSQGEPPTHPQLLDWLASEFVATGWDVKKLVRLLVTSRTYRQDSYVSPQLLELDPANKLLARGARFRLDAEVLRDQALDIGGLLRPEIGGPPVRPYQPINIWEPVAFGGSNTKVYVQDHGDALYRRSLYTFWKRTAPAPSMVTFDAPSRENFCAVRGRSNTPLQALALMNDVQQFEAARAFAGRMLLAKELNTDTARLTAAFRSVTARVPTRQEQTLLTNALATHRAHYVKNPADAAKVIANGESKPQPIRDVPEFAAWTMVANLLLNLDETVTRN